MLFLLLACNKPDDSAVTDTLDLTGLQVMVAETGDGALMGRGPDRQKPLLDLQVLDPAHCDPAEHKGNDCLIFEGEKQPEGWLASWCWNDGDTSGAPGVVSLASNNQPVWEVRSLDFGDVDSDLATECESRGTAHCALNMPHSAHWLPDHLHLVVADTMNSRLLVVNPPNSAGRAQVVLRLSSDLGTEFWDGYRYPNGTQVWDEEGRTLLLSTFKAGDRDNQGRIVLWDLSDLAAPRRLWEFPEHGYLAAVHNGLVATLPQGAIMTYGHSFGDSDREMGGDQGSIGLATYNGPDTPPTYLADLVDANFGFIREAEPAPDGATMLVTDSACENPGAGCERDAQVLTVNLPALEPTGANGAFSGDHARQVLVPAEGVAPLVTGDLSYPYESDPL